MAAFAANAYTPFDFLASFGNKNDSQETVGWAPPARNNYKNVGIVHPTCLDINSDWQQDDIYNFSKPP